jgi:glycosyltransferase involved in cell wall biosynthesis
MRILVLNWQDRENPQAGGAEIHLHEIFGRLALGGMDVTAVTSGWGKAPASASLDGMRIHRIGGRHSYPFRVAGYVRRTFGGAPPFDVVIEDLNKVPVFAPTWAAAPCLLLVHHLFGSTAFQEASLPVATATWLLERPIPYLYRGTPAVAVSESTRQDLVDRGMDGDRILVIPNGVEVDRFKPASPEIRDSDPTLLYLGRLRRYKRVDLLLKAVARLRQDGLPVRLRIAGRGPHEGALRAEAAALGLGSDAVQFLGFISEEEKLSLLQTSWVHLLTSPREGWGIANLEAAACGTPTVASDAPGLRDSVRHGETGFLVPHGDVAALAQQIRTLVSDPELRARQGAQARAFALGFQWDRSALAMGNALEAVASGGW